jgi:predicted GNAT family acetyltransferase
MFALGSRVGASALADKAATTDRAVARSVLNARFLDAVIDVLRTRVRRELRAKGLGQCAIAHAIATAAPVRIEHLKRVHAP